MASAHAGSLAAIALAVVGLVPVLAHASQEDELASATSLYEQAEYEGALAILDRLADTSPDAAVRPGQDRIAEYRALCLIALGRLPEAEQALEPLLLRKPLYRPQSADAPPRFVTLLETVRTRVLPAAIRARFRDARKSFDTGDRSEAQAGFRDVVSWMEQPELTLEERGALEDIGVLAQGFLTLMAAAAEPAATSKPAASATTPPPPAATKTAGGSGSTPANGETSGGANDPEIFGPEDQDVVAPQTVRRPVPPWPSTLGRMAFDKKQIVLELVVSATGDVESVVAKGSVNPLYDTLLMQAARSWSFRPATRGGVPVRYRKPVLVTVTPSGQSPE